MERHSTRVKDPQYHTLKVRVEMGAKSLGEEEREREEKNVIQLRCEEEKEEELLATVHTP